MSLGTPPVVYACPSGMVEVIEDGVHGFLVPPGERETFAQPLIQLLTDPDLHQRMPLAARERAGTLHPDRILPDYLDLLQDLAAR